MKLLRKFSGFHLVLLTIIGPSFLIYFLKANVFLDPDFGWRIHIGEIILKNGIPHTDPLSYTMPSYPYVDYEWLTHLIMAQLYSVFGYAGLALIFTLLAISTILVTTWDSGKKFIPLHFLFASAVLFSYFGVRPQVLTWFFFVIVVSIVSDEQRWKRYKYFSAFFFLLWANLHAGFILGLIVLCIAAFQRKDAKDFIIVVLSIFITSINPYGVQLWKEIWISLTDVPIRLLIIEWRPIFFSLTPVLALFIVYCLTFILQYRKAYKAFELLLFLLLCFAAFSSARNIPLFVLYCIIMLKKGTNAFMSEVVRLQTNLFRFRFAYAIFFGAVLLLACFQMKGDYIAATTRTENTYYPRRAVNYLSRKSPDGRIFTNYEWGGYLGWKLPQKKVFIDGRMASWRQTQTFMESKYAFGDYNSVIKLEIPLDDVFKKYAIDSVLVPRAWLTERKGDSTSEITSQFVKEVEKKFSKVYEDNVSILYSQKNTLNH